MAQDDDIKDNTTNQDEDLDMDGMRTDTTGLDNEDLMLDDRDTV